MSKFWTKNKCLVSSKENINKWYAHKDVCKDLPIDFDGYCILHYPDDNKYKNTNFEEIVNNKIENGDYKFDFVYFPKVIFLENKIFENDVSFNSAIFSQGAFFRFSEFQKEVDFNCAIFNGANFQKAKFHKYTSLRFARFNEIYVSLLPDGYELNGADFRGVVFDGNTDFSKSVFFSTANFSGCELNKEIYFQQTEFSNNCYFNKVNLREGATAFFDKTSFCKIISFDYAYLIGHISFDGNYENPVFKEETQLSLQHTKIKNPQNIGFHTVRLFPNWFVNSDSRKFVFSNVNWENTNPISVKQNINSELQNLENLHNISNPKYLLNITLRHLATNYLDNDGFEEASSFRRMAFETEWLEKKERILNWVNNLIPESEKLKRRFGGSTDEEDKPNPPTNSFGILRRSADFIIHGLYRITSFYGESWSWAAFVLAIIIFFSAFLYTRSFSDFEKGNDNGLNGHEAVSYSIRIMALQRPEPFPKNEFAKYIVAIESVLAPLQLALLALAIRRKFMR